MYYVWSKHIRSNTKLLNFIIALLYVTFHPPLKSAYSLIFSFNNCHFPSHLKVAQWLNFSSLSYLKFLPSKRLIIHVSFTSAVSLTTALSFPFPLLLVPFCFTHYCQIFSFCAVLMIFLYLRILISWLTELKI